MNTTHARIGTVSLWPAVLEDGRMGMAAYATVEVKLCGMGSRNAFALNQLGHKIDCLIDGIENIPEPL